MREIWKMPGELMLKIEDRGMFAAFIFYAITGVVFLALLPLSRFPPHIGILGIWSLATGLWTVQEAEMDALLHCTLVFRRHNVLLVHYLRVLSECILRKNPIMACCRDRVSCSYLGFYGLHSSKEVEADNLGLGLWPRGALLRNDLHGSRDGICVHIDRSFCPLRSY